MVDSRDRKRKPEDLTDESLNNLREKDTGFTDVKRIDREKLNAFFPKFRDPRAFDFSENGKVNMRLNEDNPREAEYNFDLDNQKDSFAGVALEAKEPTNLKGKMFNRNKTLSVDVKGEPGATIEIKLEGSGKAPEYHHTFESDQYERVEIPLDFFKKKGVDLEKVEKLTVATNSRYFSEEQGDRVNLSVKAKNVNIK